MKSTFIFFAVLALLLLAAVPALGASGISLDEIIGSWTNFPDEYLCTGTNVIFKFRLTNETEYYIRGMTNGFKVYSPDGADWNSVHGEWLIDCHTWFDLWCGTSPFGVTGSGADTIGFGGSKLMQQGIPPGFDSVAFLIAVGPIDDDQGGRHLCIDSSYYPPSGIWMWAFSPGDNFLPSWDGPHCFMIEVIPCDDQDGDGVYCGCDNCEHVYNPDQTDSNWDGVGDACVGYCCIIRGDIDHNGSPQIDIADLVFMVDFMFTSGPPPICGGEMDVNASGAFDISDLVYMVEYMFEDGPAPVACP
ncbi:MAG: hypothetical protein KAW46_00215 [candidate division Zixibacteria bacterium]|nr:hypothetical protein [candidate division Zixibacteria bacterium]